MNWFRALTMSLLLCSSMGTKGAEAEKVAGEPFIEIEGEVEYDLALGLAQATNGVVVRYETVELMAERVLLNRLTGWVEAEGRVTLQREGQMWRGDRLKYNFFTKALEASNYRTGRSPVYAAGVSLGANSTNQTYTAEDSLVTTDDVAEPGHRLKAKSVVIMPGKWIEARHATLYLGKVPVFYFPYYYRTLAGDSNHFEVTPGYRSAFGPYLLGTYYWYSSTNVSGQVHLDYRAERGPGGGVDFEYDLQRAGRGGVRSYYVMDQDPGRDVLEVQNPDNRFRVYFEHQANPLTNLAAKVAVRYQSDRDITKEFFESEYQDNPQPITFFELSKFWPNWSLDVLAQPQVNDFFETTERLPDIRLTGVRQQLGISPFYYDSESSFGYLTHQYITNDLPDFGALRFDSYHQLVLPQTFLGWLNLAPRVGGRFTHYGEVNGVDTVATRQDRWVFNTGAELSFKASRVWNEARSGLLGVNGLRHILEPSLNYAYVPTPSQRPPELPQFDRDLPALRLLPLDFTDYNSIDSIDSQNAVRVGLRNKLQTKRAEGLDNLLNWAIYTDWRIDPRNAYAAPDIYGTNLIVKGLDTFSDLYSDLDFKPRWWLTLNSQIRVNIHDGSLRLADHGIALQPNTTWHWRLGHRYLEDEFYDDPWRYYTLAYGQGNNLFYSTMYYRFSENWGARMVHRYNLRHSFMEDQQYAIYRDLRSWTAALTFRIREDLDGEIDYTVAFTFSLKASPRYRVGQDARHPTLLLGS